MTEFNPIKARQEIVTGLTEIHKVFLTRMRDAERKLTEAESELNACRQMEAYARLALDEARAKLKQLQEGASP